MDKKYIGNVLLYLVIGVVALFLIAFVLYHLLGWGSVNYSTRPAARITAEDRIEADAYLFRSESVISVPAGKRAYTTLKSGENVRRNDAVFTLCDCTEAELAQLRGYDAAIALLKEAGEKSDLSLIDGKLKALTSELRAKAASGGLSDAAKELDSLQTELDRRKKTLGAVSDYSNEITRFSTLRANLLSKIGVSETVRSPEAGNFYPESDGYEKVFDSAKLPSLTPADFEELIVSDPESAAEGYQRAGTVVTDPRWRIAMEIPSARAVDLVQGRTYELVLLSDEERLSAKLERMTTDAERGKALLVFVLTELPFGRVERCETVYLVFSTSSGLMVPSAAMRCIKNAEGQDVVGVYIKEGNRFRFKKVEILSRHDGYYLVKEMTPDLEGYKEYLALNDIIVTAGKNLREGYHE